VTGLPACLQLIQPGYRLRIVHRMFAGSAEESMPDRAGVRRRDAAGGFLLRAFAMVVYRARKVGSQPGRAACALGWTPWNPRIWISLQNSVMCVLR